MVIATSWASQASAAVIKYNLVDADLRHFLFIENQEDHNLFITPTDYLDPRLTGGNAWTTDSRQVSLAYADNGHNYTVTNYNIDMWENGPVKYPYINQRCIKSWAGCDPQTAEAMNKPASVNETGFFGLMKAATGYAHAKLSSAFFDYLRTMPAGGILNREMNLCMTTRIYDAAAGERCINQDSGTWYVKRTQHKKAGHLRFIQTNAISEVIVDSNGAPYVLPVHKVVRIIGWVHEMECCAAFWTTTSIRMAASHFQTRIFIPTSEMRHSTAPLLAVMYR